MAGDYSEFFGMDVTVLLNTKANEDEYALYIHEGGLLGECYATDLDFDDLVSDKELGADKTYETSGTTLTYLAFNNGAWTQDDSTLASVKLIDTTGDNKVDTLVYLPFSIEKVTLNTSGNVKLADVTMYDGVAKDDYAKVVETANTVKASKTFTKLDAQSGTVDGYKTVSGTDRYLVAGTWMKLAGAAAGKLTGSTNVGATISYYAFGNVIYDLKITSGAQGLEDLVMVADYTTTATTGHQKNTYSAKLLFADGSKKTANIVNADGDPANPSAFLGKVCTFEVNNSGNYVLTALSSGNKAGYENVGTTNLTLKDAAYSTSNSTAFKFVDDNTTTRYEINDNAVVFWYNDTEDTGKMDAKVYTGKELKSLMSDTTLTVSAYATSKANGFESVAVVAVTDSTTSAWPNFTVGSTYGYLTSDAYTTYDSEAEKWYVNYTMWTANGEVTAKEEGKTLTDRVAGNVVCYNTIDANGIVKNLRVVSADLGVVTGWDGKKIAITGTTPLTTEVVSDTQIIYVNSDKKTGVEGGAITEGAIVGGSTPNVYNVRYFKHATKDQLAVIIVDVNNEMKAATVTTLANSASATIINNALVCTDKVVIDDDYNATGAIYVGAGKTLTIKGKLTASNDITGNGKLVVNTFNNTTAASHAKTKTVEVALADTTANLETVSGTYVKTLIVKVASTGAVSASTWYTDAGAAPTTAAGTDGTIGTALASPAVVGAGTYVYGTVYTNNDGTHISAWVKQ